MADKVRVDPTTGSQNWQSGFGASGAKYQRGVEGVTTAPNAKAAAALPRWVASVTSKSVQDKYVSKNQAVSLSDWQNATVTYGVPNLSRGAAKGQSKYATFATKFYPFLSSNLSKVNAMPNVTLQDRIAKAVALMQANSTFKA